MWCERGVVEQSELFEQQKRLLNCVFVRCIQPREAPHVRFTECGELKDRSQLILLVREQRMFLSKPETGYRCRDL